MKRIPTKLSVFVFLLLLFAGTASAQNITITGTVIDAADKSPLPGVGVLVKGTQIGTTTSSSGAYSINAPADATLVFTYIGFTTQEVAVGNRTTINITLAESAQDLEAVVVVGYGTQRRRDVTGSISTVSGETIARQPNVNPLSSLQGQVAGLTIVNSGSPGASPTVRIRGINSVNGAAPLYVVDGVHQSNIDYLNPADIESIEVLRDPSSIAIFGLQAGNGVIVVTTKRAARGETRVTLQSSAGIQKVQKLIDVTNASEFRKLYDQLLAATPNATPFDYSNYTGDTDWQKEILQSAFQSNNSLTISNNGEKTSTLINLGYNTQEGVIKFGRFQRFVARVNEEINVTDKIKVGADITGTHWILNASSGNLNNALWAAPIVGIRESETAYYAMPSFQRAQVGNPVATIYQNDRNSINKGYRAVGSLFAEIGFLDKFKWRSQVYTDLGFNNSRGYTPLPFTMIYLGENGEPTEYFNNPQSRTSVRQAANEYRKFQQDHTLTYDNTFNESHKVTAVAGMTSIVESSTLLSGSRTDVGLNIPDDQSFWYVGLPESTNPTNLDGSGTERASLGFFARVNYAYNNKYLINATFRRDGISRLAPQNRWGNFGGIGLGWVVSEENFFKINGIDFLKIRGAWGTVGNAQGISDAIFLPGLTTSNSGVFGDNVYPGVAPAYIPDPRLRWEVVRGADIGLDIRALDNRLTSEINVYDKTSKDIITDITLPSANGSYRYRTNLGTITNRGVEVNIGWNDKLGENFTYGISPNFSYNKNKVVSIGNNINYLLIGNGGANRTITGESIGHFYGYRQVGIYQSTADLDRMPRMNSSLPGDIAYADLDGDGRITEADRENLGSPFPAWNYGINLNMGYKGFDLVLQGQGVAGNHVYVQRRNVQFTDINFERNRLNAWNGPGTSNVEPALVKGRGNNYLMSTYFLEPGDYFRLRTVQLGYTMNADALKSTGLKSVRFYLSGQNLQTWSRTTGYTPEAPIESILGGGADNGTYPVPAVYTFGINATF
ncbi:SusC/RagA family TonB-linked outer membrane protein [Pedobacter faecalis]|uniref:SusC/RagA family TonB-linked outer membrane protein n=1 Tax=Pedobacter faecalis TaxID=3041495 RepID=UPI00254ABBCF|nr:TonB-dependent receptor [Pedobacter sp. ELA7]